MVDLSVVLERGGSTATSVSVKSAEVPDWNAGKISLIVCYFILLTYHAFSSLMQAVRCYLY